MVRKIKGRSANRKRDNVYTGIESSTEAVTVASRAGVGAMEPLQDRAKLFKALAHKKQPLQLHVHGAELLVKLHQVARRTHPAEVQQTHRKAVHLVQPPHRHLEVLIEDEAAQLHSPLAGRVSGVHRGAKLIHGSVDAEERHEPHRDVDARRSSHKIGTEHRVPLLRVLLHEVHQLS